jgi:hypothetical protein
MECCICNEKIEIEDKVGLECAHIYHTRCVIKLIQKRLRKCPLCRTKIRWNTKQLFTHEKLFIQK